MTTAAVFGCTGAIGRHILSLLLEQDAFTSVTTISRRAPPQSSPKLHATVEADTMQWSPLLSSLAPAPDIVFNAVGTTRAAAGGVANQWKIDHDLCVENARAAKAAGVRTYFFVSSHGCRGAVASRFVPYCQMKNGVEDAIRALDFDQAIIIRPGMILGARETPQKPVAEAFVSGLGAISQGLRDSLG